MGRTERQAIYHTARWRNLRLTILARDGEVCQIRTPICTTVATQVDHILSIAEGGDPWHPDNLRAACQPCNGRRGGLLSQTRQNVEPWPAWLHANRG